MKAKIQRSMLLVLFVTILIFYGLLTLVMYQKNLTPVSYTHLRAHET